MQSCRKLILTYLSICGMHVQSFKSIPQIVLELLTRNRFSIFSNSSSAHNRITPESNPNLPIHMCNAHTKLRVDISYSTQVIDQKPFFYFQHQQLRPQWDHGQNQSQPSSPYEECTHKVSSRYLKQYSSYRPETKKLTPARPSIRPPADIRQSNKQIFKKKFA